MSGYVIVDVIVVIFHLAAAIVYLSRIFCSRPLHRSTATTPSLPTGADWRQWLK